VINKSPKPEPNAAVTAQWANPDGTPIVQGSLAFSTTQSYTSTNIPCTGEVLRNGVKLYTLASGITVSSGIGTKSAAGVLKYDGGRTVYDEAQVAKYGNISIILRDTANANLSDIAATGQADGVIAEDGAVALSEGTARTFYIDIEQKTANFAYGSPHSGLFWVFDKVDDNFDPSDLSLTPSTPNFAISEVSCSAYPNAALKLSADKCWKSPAIKATDGFLQLKATLRATHDVSSDPKIHIKTLEYGQDRNGKLILDGYDAGFTAFGPLPITITPNIS